MPPREGVAVLFAVAPLCNRVVCLEGLEQTTRDRKGDKTMPTGTVKWFNATKGYGFIGPEAGGKDIFVHISAVQKAGMRTLNEGQKLAFEVEQQANGRAAAVNLAETA
jgi:CspA family cold shock protein